MKRSIAIYIAEFNELENKIEKNENNCQENDHLENISTEKKSVNVHNMINKGLQIRHFTAVLKTMKSSVSDIEIDEYNDWKDNH
jgi:SpoVK/Ycf46/Vps4 family AAA+-type ATPase